MILKKKMDPRGSSAFKMLFEGENLQGLANGQNIDYSEKKKIRKWPKGFICSCTGVKYHNIQICLLVYETDLR